MASGYYSFVAGAKPLATEWNDYVAKQVVGVYADSTARDTALSSVLREGLVAYLTGSNEVTYYSGAAWRTLWQEPATWTVGNITQSASVSTTTNFAQRKNIYGEFWATATITCTSAGTAGNAITIPTPYTLTNSDAIGGCFTLVDSGTTVYEGSIYPSTTTAFVLQIDQQTGRLGATPSFALANTDVIRFDIHGWT